MTSADHADTVRPLSLVCTEGPTSSRLTGMSAGDRLHPAPMIEVAMADDQRVDRADALAAQIRQDDQFASIATAAECRPGVVHQRVGLCSNDDSKSLPHVQQCEPDIRHEPATADAR